MDLKAVGITLTPSQETELQAIAADLNAKNYNSADIRIATRPLATLQEGLVKLG